MTLRGHTAAHCRQPVHFSGSTFATPSTTWMASKRQAETHEPKPRQPLGQAEGPLPPTNMAERQSWMPS